MPTDVQRATTALLDDVPRRAARDTKYSSGSVLVIGGQPGTTGAACLTAMAALRADAGYVTLAVPEESLHAVEVLALEPVKLPWSDDDALETLAGAERRPRLRSGRVDARSAASARRASSSYSTSGGSMRRLFGSSRRALVPTVLRRTGELARLLDRDAAWWSASLEAALRWSSATERLCS